VYKSSPAITYQKLNIIDPILMKWRCVEVGGSKIRGVMEISELGGAIPGVVQIPVDYVSLFAPPNFDLYD
jgi:hypothetical protein